MWSCWAGVRCAAVSSVTSIAVGPQGVERVAEIGRGPQHAGVGDEGEAQCLVDLVIEMTSSDVALMGEEQVAPQRMQAFALVELTPYPAT